MGIFDRFTSKKAAPPSAPGAIAPVADTTVNGSLVLAAEPGEPAATPASALMAGLQTRFASARERLEAKDLSGALAIYEHLLNAAGDRADVLVTISGDLGSHGHLTSIIELIAPRYDSTRHGPATGLNLLQAYLAVQNAEAAQHILDILFALNRPELEDRLHGFSNAVAELINAPDNPAGSNAHAAAKVGLITFSKPIWFYGLEALADQLLPSKEGRLRRIAFAQLAVPGNAPKTEAEARKPEDELGRLSRAIPLWFTETFYYSTLYAPVTAVGIMTPPEGSSHIMTFGAEWTIDNLRQLVDSTEGGLDYIVTGALRCVAADYELVTKIWEVNSFRERKTFITRWTPATVEASLTQLHAKLRAYMEWSPANAAFAYAIPTEPRGWLDTLAASMNLFLVEKNILPREQLAPVDEDLRAAGRRAASSEAATLAYLTLSSRAAKLGTIAPAGVTLASSPRVVEAQQALAS